MNLMRALIVDDEPLARLRLRSLLHGCTETPVEVVGEAGDAQQALDMLRRFGCDLILLDIRMPGRDGLQLASALQSWAHPPAVVFVSAHDQYALHAFDLGAVDYLTKPVQRERLQAALQRVAQRRWPLPKAGDPGAEAPALVVSCRTRVLRIPLREVLYLKAALKYVTLRTTTRSHVVDEPLVVLARRLGEGFVRVHRNALVARLAVRELRWRSVGSADECWAVRVAPLDEWLPVSRRQLGAMREALAIGGT